MLELLELRADDYDKLLPSLPHFQKAGYQEHYKGRVENVYHLLFKGRGFQMGISGGIRESVFFSPFSGPYGGFSMLGSKYSHSKGVMAMGIFQDFLRERGVEKIYITQAPFYQDQHFSQLITNAFQYTGFQLKEVAINQVIPLDSVSTDGSHLKGSAKNKFNQFSQKMGGCLGRAVSLEDQKEVYELIKKSRDVRKKPLKMSFYDLLYAHSFKELEFYLLKQDGKSIASAILVNTAPLITHVIYWGHEVGCESCFPMHQLSYQLSLLKKSQGYRHLDLGISTDVTSPDFGLLDFKASIGASPGLRLSWEKKLD